MAQTFKRDILEAALRGLEAQKLKLDEQIAQIRNLIGSHGPSKSAAKSNRPMATATAARKRHILSPEARKRIAAAQKKRWAAFKKNRK